MKTAWQASALALLGILAASPADAQSRSGVGLPPPPDERRPARANRLVVPNMLLLAPASEMPFAIRIERMATLPPNSFVRIQGLPTKIALSDGYAIAPGSWAVPLKALSELRIVVPAGLAGKSEAVVSIVSVDGGVIATARVGIVVAPAALATREVAQGTAADASAGLASIRKAPPPPPPPAPAVSDTPPARAAVPLDRGLPPKQPGPVAALVPQAREAAPVAQPSGPALDPQARQRARDLIDKGKARMAQGNVSLARLFFERAADIGEPTAALAMGDTFDPTELSERGVVGVQPDIAEARRWYERARDLGAGTAALRKLERLGRR